jgi:hypothetical protein
VIINVLKLTLKDDTTDQRREVLAALRQTSTLPWVTFASVGPDFTDPTGRTIGYVTAIADLTALERYMHDPVHLSGDDVILPRVASLSAVRFSDDDDPTVGAAVYALHQAKLNQYPDWARQLDEIVVD